MRPSIAALLVSACCGLTVACDSNPALPSAAPPGSSAEQLVLKLATSHFRIFADRTAPATVQAVADALEASYPRVTADLRTGDLPIVTASVWQDPSSFYDVMRRNTGQVFVGAGGYVTGPQGVALLAGGSVARSASHEFVHVVSMAVNASIANNPRWLWETVALYENGEFVDPATVDFLQAGRYPTIAALDLDFNSSHQVYQVGYVLGEFIVATWGMEGLLSLVRTNGHIPSSLGLAVTEFERLWYVFLQARYRTPAVVAQVSSPRPLLVEGPPRGNLRPPTAQREPLVAIGEACHSRVAEVRDEVLVPEHARRTARGGSGHRGRHGNGYGKPE